ncbi:MAG: methyltransferase domain-containing protein [Patescibacteria group bacterium]|jgi:2-polyprenyl-3-methyl-5-hydroxy-6-metoxy-1,4-benzoquinol methylase|nr:methyltransferase domain-containing protein [Patescibacteria group bacterium]
MTNKQALQKAYTILSPYSDKQIWEFNNNLIHLRYITKHVPKISTILDVGCGIGILDIALKILGYKVTGIDKYLFEEDNSFNVRDISGLHRVWEGQGIEILPKDILDDEIGKKYDSVISIATIEHQKDPKKFLERLLGVVHSHGFIYIATPNISHLLNRVRFVFGKSPSKAHLPEFFSYGDKYVGHWREYTLNELRQIFKWLNMEIIDARNVQSMRVRFKLSSLRSWYVNLFRLISYVLPGTRDANIIIGRKK